MSNTVIVTGNLVAPPELKFTPAGAAFVNFTVADTPRRKNEQTGQWEDAGEALFLRCTMWRDAAEHLAEQELGKGQRVTVTGRLKARSWEKDGVKRTEVECDADSVAVHPRRASRTTAAPQSDPWGTQPPSDTPPF